MNIKARVSKLEKKMRADDLGIYVIGIPGSVPEGETQGFFE